MIPKDADKKMTAATADLLSAIKRASLLTTEEAQGVRFTFNKKGLTLTSRSPEAGEAEVRFACKFDGGDVEIGFNPDFLRAGLEAVEEGDVLLKLISPLRPGLIESADGSGFLYLIMPIRLNV